MKARPLFLARCAAPGFFMLLAACAAPPNPPVAVRVNGEAITLAQVDEERRFLDFADQDDASALDNLVDQALILQEGRRMGARFAPGDPSAAEALALQGTEVRLLDEALKAKGLTHKQWAARILRAYEADRVVNLAVRANLEVDKQEVQDQYWTHLLMYRRPERRVLRQIFTRARSTAEGAMRALELGEPFAEAAAQLGQGPEASVQGLIGSYSRGQLPRPLSQAAFDLKPGTFSPIVASPWGYHILYYESRLAPESDTLDQAAPKARATLLAAKEQIFYQAWLARLREQAVLERPQNPAPAPSNPKGTS
jgi:parvulin-like peptidyl-prolyl isomerase